MISLYLLIPLTIVLLIVACGFFVWAVQRGQFDNLQRYEKKMPDEL